MLVELAFACCWRIMNAVLFLVGKVCLVCGRGEWHGVGLNITRSFEKPILFKGQETHVICTIQDHQVPTYRNVLSTIS